MNAPRAGFRPLLLVLLTFLLSAWMPGSALAGSFTRVPNPPPASTPVEATGAATGQAASPAAQAEETDAAEEGTPAAKGDEKPTSTDGGSEVETEDQEAADEDLPEGEPTYGSACIYGPRGVVHTPIGRDCEADQAKRAGVAKAASAQRAESESTGSGSCIFGQHGEVVYAPPGVRCDGKVRETQKPKNEEKAPRSIRYRPGR